MGFNYGRQIHDSNDLCHMISDMGDTIDELTEENEKLEETKEDLLGQIDALESIIKHDRG